MLTKEERLDAYKLVARAECVGPAEADALCRARIWDAWRALEMALRAYGNEACLGTNARLDCLTTMVRAGVGALRERLDDRHG